MALFVCANSAWADGVTLNGKAHTWTTATSVTVGSSALNESSLSAGKKIVFARKSNSSKYLTVSSNGQICGAADATGYFADATANSVFTVGGSANAWTFESADKGYYFPSLTNSNWEARYTSTTAATFSFKATDDGDNSFFIKSNEGGKWFDGNNSNFTAWEGSGDNAKYYIYEATLEGKGTKTTYEALGTLSNGQYAYTSDEQTGAVILNTIRLTFKSTTTNNLCNGYPFVHLAELYLIDAKGKEIDLSKYKAEDIFSSNATQNGEGTITALNDGVTTGANTSYDWYWHSAWINGPSEYHYLEIKTSEIDADLTKFKIGYITRNTNCVPCEIELSTTSSSVEDDADYIAAKKWITGEDVKFVGLPEYSYVKELKEALEADEPNASEIYTAYKNFTNNKVNLVEGKTYRIVSAYPSFLEKGDNKEKAIYSDGSGMIWKAEDATDDYFKSIWAIANIDGNNFTMFNLYDGSYPQAVNSIDTKTPVSRTSVNNCILTSFGAGQFSIKSNGCDAAFHCGGHNKGAGTSGNIVKWDGELNSCSAWYIREVNDIVMPETGYYQISHANTSDAKYIQNDANSVGANATSSIKTFFSIEKNNDGTYYIKGDNGMYIQSANMSTKVSMSANPVKYQFTRSAEGKWDLRAQEVNGTYQYLHTNNNTIVVGWSIDTDNSRWTIEKVEGYTFFPVTFAEGTYDGASISVGTEGYTGNTTIYDGGFYALASGTPTTSDFTSTSAAWDATATVENGAISVSFAKSENADAQPSFITLSNEESNTYYYIRCTSTTDRYLRALKDDFVGHSQNKEENGASVFQFYDAGIGANGFQQYYIYNTGAQAWVSYNATSGGEKKEPLVVEKAQAKTWRIIADSETSIDVIPGDISTNVDNTQSWNVHGGFGKTYLGLYDRNDDYSSWTPEVVTLDGDALAAVKKNYVLYYATNYADQKGNLGYISNEFYTSLTECADITALRATWEGRTSENYTRPVSGRYYKFQGVADKAQYIVDAVASNNVNRVGVSATDENNIWLYIDGKLMGYKSGKKLINNGNGFLKLADRGVEGVDIYFEKSNEEGRMLIHYDSRQAWSNTDNCIDAANYPNNDLGYKWVITEVNELPVTVSGAGYATFSAPVAVTVPDNVEAFIATESNGTSVTLKKVEGTVAANTGLLLKKEGGVSTNFTIQESGNTTDGNLLKAAVTVTAVAPDNATPYILALDDAGKAKFFQLDPDDNVFGGHKAYLEIPNVDGSSAKSISIIWGDNTLTSLDSILNNTTETGIYDLQGRRVNSLVKGGIYIKNGQKFMAK